MYVDASAIVAILTKSPEADALLAVLDTARSAVTSPVALAEAAAGLCETRRLHPLDALGDVRAFITTARIRVVSLTEFETEGALEAFGRFGGFGLSLAACFGYAIAKALGVPILFAEGPFRETDAPSASG